MPEPITKPIRGLAKTPPGVFQRRPRGRRASATARSAAMWDPVYINQGIAIHGANNVPLEPASHGCIRVSRYLGPIVQDLIDKGDAVLIWDGKKEPEQQTAKDRQMIWDWVDLSRTTTTTSTTTTTTTTVAPTTTAAPADDQAARGDHRRADDHDAPPTTTSTTHVDHDRAGRRALSRSVAAQTPKRRCRRRARRARRRGSSRSSRTGCRPG